MRREADVLGGAPGLRLAAVAWGVVAGYVLTIAVAALLALLVYGAGLGEGIAETAVFYAGILCLAAGAAYGARRAGTEGWLHGAVIGIVYVVLALALSVLVLGGDVTAMGLLGRLLLGVVAGIVGGVAGINA